MSWEYEMLMHDTARHRQEFAWALVSSVLLPGMYCAYFMKTLTVRLPEPLVADIEAESRARKISKSDLVRERLEVSPRRRRKRSASLRAIADLIGSVDGLPTDLSANKKKHLRDTGYGQKRPR
jgi:hypothetical protein